MSVEKQKQKHEIKLNLKHTSSFKKLIYILG